MRIDTASFLRTREKTKLLKQCRVTDTDFNEFAIKHVTGTRVTQRERNFSARSSNVSRELASDSAELGNQLFSHDLFTTSISPCVSAK